MRLGDLYPTAPSSDEAENINIKHEFFVEWGFLERLFDTTELMAPDSHIAAMDKADLTFLTHVILGDSKNAYEALKARAEIANSRVTEDGIYMLNSWYLLYELGPLAVSQCLEFAAFWHIQDPDLNQMLIDNETEHMVARIENPWDYCYTAGGYCVSQLYVDMQTRNLFVREKMLDVLPDGSPFAPPQDEEPVKHSGAEPGNPFQLTLY